MRYRLAHVVIFAVACLLAGKPHLHAQTAAPEVESGKSCPPAASNHKEPYGPEVSVAGVAFSGFLRMPVSDQDEIATSIKKRTYRDSLDGATDEALERVRAGWQNHGYFKVRVKGYATALDSTPSRRIALSVQVDEGPQYALGGIAFKHNRAVSNFESLRDLFPIKDGDVFSREKIATGLENLRKAYGELGYVSLVAIPNTRFDDKKRLSYVDIDVEEGKQFYVEGVNILGVDESSRAQVLRDFALQPGQVYNQRLVELSIKHDPMLTNCECGDWPSLRLDDKRSTVTLTFDFRSCLGGR